MNMGIQWVCNDDTGIWNQESEVWASGNGSYRRKQLLDRGKCLNRGVKALFSENDTPGCPFLFVAWFQACLDSPP